MKNNPKKNVNEVNYLDDINDSEDENNNNIFGQINKKDDSLEQYFKPMDDNHESEDILKQLENLNLSEEKSFEMPQKIFQPLAEKNKGKTNSSSNKKDKKLNNKIDKPDNLYDLNDKDNNKEIYTKYNLLNEIKKENNMNENNDNNKQALEEIISNGEDN